MHFRFLLSRNCLSPRSILCSWLLSPASFLHTLLLEMVIISKMAPFIHVGGFSQKGEAHKKENVSGLRAATATKAMANFPTTLKGHTHTRSHNIEEQGTLMHNVPHQFLFAYTVFHPPYGLLENWWHQH